MALIYGALGTSSIVDFQDQFAQLSEDFEPRLRDFRTENNQVRIEVIHRMLNGLAKLTVEVRDITRDHWAAIEAHDLATPECLELIRTDFDYYVQLVELDIKAMALEMDYYVRGDAVERFNRDARMSERFNSELISRSIRILGEIQFFPRMDDTVEELSDELGRSRVLQGSRDEQLKSEISRVSYLEDRAESSIAWWYDFTVMFYRVVMAIQVGRPDYECQLR